MTAGIDAKFWLDVRDKPALLTELMRALQGNARMSLEGDLKQCNFGPELNASSEETDALKRASLTPEFDFIVVAVEEATVGPILKQILQAGFRRIIHIQIEKAGRLRFGAYDNFHPDCVVIDDALPAEHLQELAAKRVLRSFVPADKPGGTSK